MNNFSSHCSALKSAVAVVAAALPATAHAQSVNRTYTGGTAQNRTSWFTTTNWDAGIYAGVPTPATGGTTATGSRTVTDIASTAATLKVTGAGINFSSTGLNGGTLTLGAIVHNTTALGSAGTSTTLTWGNNGTAGINGTTTITGTVALNGATMNVGATGGSLDNVVAAISDSATTNLSRGNQSVGTSPGTTAITYQLNNSISGFYVAAGRTMRAIGALTQSASGTTLVKSGAGTLELGSQLNGVASSAVNAFDNLTINGGTVIVDGGLNSLGGANGVITLRNASKLQFNYNTASLASTKTIALAGGGMIDNNTYVINANGAISGTGGLTRPATPRCSSTPSTASPATSRSARAARSASPPRPRSARAATPHSSATAARCCSAPSPVRPPARPTRAASSCRARPAKSASPTTPSTAG